MGVIRVSIAAFQIKGRTVFCFYFKIMDGGCVVPEFFKTGINSAGKFKAIKNGNIETGLVETVNVVPGDPIARALFSGDGQGGVFCQLSKYSYQVFFPAIVRAFNGAIGDVAGSLQGIDRSRGRYRLSLRAYTSAFRRICVFSACCPWPVG